MISDEPLSDYSPQIASRRIITRQDPEFIDALRNRVRVTLKSSGYARPVSGKYVAISDMMKVIKSTQKDKDSDPWCRAFNVEVRNLDGTIALVVDPRKHYIKTLGDDELKEVAEMLARVESFDRATQGFRRGRPLGQSTDLENLRSFEGYKEFMEAWRGLADYRMVFGDFDKAIIKAVRSGNAGSVQHYNGKSVLSHYREIGHSYVQPQDRVVEVVLLPGGVRELVPASSLTLIHRPAKGEEADKQPPGDRARASSAFAEKLSNGDIKLEFLESACSLGSDLEEASKHYTVAFIDTSARVVVGKNEETPIGTAFKGLAAHGPYNNPYDLGYVLVLPNTENLGRNANVDDVLRFVNALESEYSRLGLGALRMLSQGLHQSEDKGFSSYKEACLKAKARMSEVDIALVVLPWGRGPDFYYRVKDLFISGRESRGSQMIALETILSGPNHCASKIASLCWLNGLEDYDHAKIAMSKGKVLEWFRSGLSEEHFRGIMEQAREDVRRYNAAKSRGRKDMGNRPTGLTSFLMENPTVEDVRERIRWVQQNVEVEEVAKQAELIMRKNSYILRDLTPVLDSIAAQLYMKGGKYNQSLWVLSEPADSHIEGITPGGTCYIKYRSSQVRSDMRVVRTDMYVTLVDAKGMLYFEDKIQSPGALNRQTFYKMVESVLRKVSEKRETLNFTLELMNLPPVPELQRIVFYQMGPMNPVEVAGIKALQDADLGRSRSLSELTGDYGFNRGLTVDLVSLTNKSSSSVRLYAVDNESNFINPDEGALVYNDEHGLFIVKQPAQGTVVPLQMELEAHITVGCDTPVPQMPALAKEYKSLVYLNPNPIQGSRTILERLSSQLALWDGHDVDVRMLRDWAWLL